MYSKMTLSNAKSVLLLKFNWMYALVLVSVLRRLKENLKERVMRSSKLGVLSQLSCRKWFGTTLYGN